jgi:hypothetical protein
MELSRLLSRYRIVGGVAAILIKKQMSGEDEFEVEYLV